MQNCIDSLWLGDPRAMGEISSYTCPYTCLPPTLSVQRVLQHCWLQIIVPEQGFVAKMRPRKMPFLPRKYQKQRICTAEGPQS